MDAKTFEKLYGMRPVLLLLMMLVLGVCLLFIFSPPFISSLFGQKEVLTVIPLRATSTEIANPTLISIPTNEPPIPTSLPSPTPLATTTESPNPVITPAPGVSEMIVCTGVKDGYLNFRVSPQSSVIDLLGEGEHVTLIKKADTLFPWYFIEVDGTQGYAYGAYLCTP